MHHATVGGRSARTFRPVVKAAGLEPSGGTVLLLDVMGQDADRGIHQQSGRGLLTPSKSASPAPKSLHTSRINYFGPLQAGGGEHRVPVRDDVTSDRHTRF